MSNPLTLLVLIGVSVYVIKLWFDDYRNAAKGRPNERALPGATGAPPKAYLIAAIGAAVILSGETWGEISLGLAGQQSNMTVLFAGYTLCAAFVEEIIFRGYIIKSSGAPAARWLVAIGASILFAALHPFLWDWTDGKLILHLDAKGSFSTAVVFVTSIWFYIARLAAFNPRQSLGPCFAGHLTKNIGVIFIKAFQGHIAGLY